MRKGKHPFQNQDFYLITDLCNEWPRFIYQHQRGEGTVALVKCPPESVAIDVHAFIQLSSVLGGTPGTLTKREQNIFF